MQGEILITLMAALISCTFAEPRTIDADIGIMQFMIGTRDLQKDNPARSLDCFEYYTPIINENYNTYERDYRGCLRTADEAKLNVDGWYGPLKTRIDSNATQLCYLLGNCKALNSSRSAFQCYSVVGSNDSLLLYDISTNASQALAEISEEYRLIEFNEDRCTNATETRYVQRTAEIYEALHNCLLGVGPVKVQSVFQRSVEKNIVTSASPLVFTNKKDTGMYSKKRKLDVISKILNGIISRFNSSN